MPEPPATPLTAAAERVLHQAAPPVVAAHSVRTYLLAAAAGERRGVGFDAEGLYVAALFHDLGLLPAFRRRDRAFAGVSAALLRDFLADHGVTGARADRLADAVALHMRPRPVWAAGPEAGLLQVGAWGDVTRLARGRPEVERAHPRGRLGRELGRLLVGSVGGPDAALGLLGLRPRRR